VGLASGMALISSTFQIKFTPALLAFSAGGVILICILSSVISVLKVLRLEPAAVFKA
jgi:putative ABC transport system permease protein